MPADKVEKMSPRFEELEKRLCRVMGKCLSCFRRAEDDTEEQKTGVDDSISGTIFGEESKKPQEDETNFCEEERRKTRDDKKVSGEKIKFRRRSSGLSRFSTNDQHVVEKPFKIAAFNVRKFGTAKMKNLVVVDILVKIVMQFDIILIQEIVDASGQAIQDLLAAVNVESVQGSYIYELVISPRLGRSNMKEQYAFLYRSNKVRVKESCTYPDPDDVFIREPFIVQFSSTSVANLSEFTILSIHTQPTSAPSEIDSLVDAHTWAVDKLGTKNVIIMGDFNAGGTFVRPADWETNRLRQDSEYVWLIADHLDTTATNTLAAYDRIVAWGEDMNESVIPYSAAVYRFDEEMKLDEETLLAVSDHFPVYCELRPTVHPTIEKNITPKIAIMVTDKRFPKIDYENLSKEFKVPKFKLHSYYNEGTELARIEIRSQKISKPEEVLSNIERLRNNIDGLISYSVLSTLKYKFSSGGVTDNTLVGDRVHWVVIVADLQNKNFTCFIEILTHIA